MGVDHASRVGRHMLGGKSVVFRTRSKEPVPMSSLLIAAFAATLLAQTPTPAPNPTPEPTDTEVTAALDQVLGSLDQMMVLMGTCETRFGPEMAQTMAQTFSPVGKTEDEQAAAALFKVAYERGKASPRAATITLEECSAELQAISTRMQAISEGLEE